jgi:putative membrane protein
VRLPPDAAELIGQAIAKAEASTSAELVVVGTPASGSYRDVDLLVGASAGMVFLLFALFSHIVFPPLGVPSGVLLCGVAGFALSWGSPPLRRLLTTRARRVRQAREAALVSFLERGVDHTRARTGVLIHLSFFERTATLVADRGVQAELSAEQLEAQRARFEAALRHASGDAVVADLCAAIAGLGATLGASRLPPDADDPNELCDVPLLECGS